MKKKLLWAGVVLALVACGAFFLWPRSTETADMPYPHDAAASAIVAAAEQALDTGAYRMFANPLLDVGADGRCEVAFQNLLGNQCHLMLDIRLKDSGLLIYRSGLINPGEEIKSVTFVKDALAAMADGAQDVVMTVHSFALRTYENKGDVSLNGRLIYGGGGNGA